MKSNFQKKQQLNPLKLFLLYTFIITWGSCLLIIFVNNYFNTLAYRTLLFWIPCTIVSLGPAISACIIYRKFKEDFTEKTFSKYIFGSKPSWKVWFIFLTYYTPLLQILTTASCQGQANYGHSPNSANSIHYF